MYFYAIWWVLSKYWRNHQITVFLLSATTRKCRNIIFLQSALNFSQNWLTSIPQLSRINRSKCLRKWVWGRKRREPALWIRLDLGLGLWGKWIPPCLKAKWTDKILGMSATKNKINPDLKINKRRILCQVSTIKLHRASTPTLFPKHTNQ